MFKIEYVLNINERNYEFSVSNESLTILKKNTKTDVIEFAKKNGLNGNGILTITILYDNEYYDSDEVEITIGKKEVELICA